MLDLRRLDLISYGQMILTNMLLKHMLGRGGIFLCPRGFPAVTVRLKLRDGAAKSPCTCGLDSEIYRPDTPNPRPYSTSGLEHTRGGTSVIQKFRPLYVRYGSSSALNGDQVSGFRPESALLSSAILDSCRKSLTQNFTPGLIPCQKPGFSN